MRRRPSFGTALGVVLAGLALAWLVTSGTLSSLLTPSTVTQAPVATAGASGSSAVTTCRLSDLPAEVAETVTLVRANGPYLRPRDDGGTFGNYEHLLPAKPHGYYREYTVSDPAASFPGPRRLITGGQAHLGDEPAVWYYTGDHYAHFCQVTALS